MRFPGTRYGWIWALSVLPLAIEALLPGGAPFPRTGRFGLVLLPWLVLVGIPSRGLAVRDPESRGTLRQLASLFTVLLPLLGLAIGLDVADGRVATGIVGPLAAVALGLSSVALLGASASLGRRSSRAHALQAWCWLILVPLGPVLRVGLGWAPDASGNAGGELLERTWWELANPVLWCVETCILNPAWGSGQQADGGLAGALLLLGACASVCASATIGSAGDPEARSETRR